MKKLSILLSVIVVMLFSTSVFAYTNSTSDMLSTAKQYERNFELYVLENQRWNTIEDYTLAESDWEYYYELKKTDEKAAEDFYNSVYLAKDEPKGQAVTLEFKYYYDTKNTFLYQTVQYNGKFYVCSWYENSVFDLMTY